MKIIKKYRKNEDGIDILICQVHTPLIKPYNLAYTELICFDSIFIIINDNNKIGIGEATILPGYFQVLINEIWDYLYDIIYNCKLINIIEGRIKISEDIYGVALTSAIEIYNDNFELNNFLECPIYSDSTNISKTKVANKGNLYEDILLINSLIEDPDKLRRIDGNQGYTKSQADIFLTHIKNPERIEYIEQLLDKNLVGDHVQLMRKFPKFKYMLDESIVTMNDLDIIINNDLADAIKLKLFKHGSINNTIKIGKNALKNYLDVIIGNGVQTHIGTFCEMICYYKLKGHPTFNLISEMNGITRIDVKFRNLYEKNNSIYLNKKEFLKEILEWSKSI